MPKRHPSRVPRASRRSPSRVVHLASSSLLCKQHPLVSGPDTGADRLEPTTSTKAADAQCATALSSTQGYAQSSMWHQSQRAEMALPQEISRRSERHTGRSLTTLTVSKLVPPGNLASAYADHMAHELYDPSLLLLRTPHVQLTFVGQLKWFDRTNCHGFLYRGNALMSTRISGSQCATL